MRLNVERNVLILLEGEKGMLQAFSFSLHHSSSYYHSCWILFITFPNENERICVGMSWFPSSKRI